MGLSDYWKDKKRDSAALSSSTSSAASSSSRGPTLPSSSSMLYPSSRGAGNSSPITAINRASNGGWNMSDGSISLTASDGSTWNTGRHIQNCFDSNNCASGWSCIGGKCAQSSAGASGSGGGTSGCGDDADNGDKCGTGDCTKSTCGESGGNPGDDTCCNKQKCCQRGDDGFVRCTCGPCPPPKVNCDAFCAAFYAAYGRRTMGCTEENTCTQCEACRLVESFQPRECVPLEPEDANCWCPQSINDPPEECQKCMGTGEWRKDCENCQACYTVNVNCGCAINTTKCCEPGCITTAGRRACLDKAWQNCYAACTPPDDDDEPIDPCVGECYGEHFCDGPLPPCPDGASCTDNGSISAGGRTCYIRTVCDKTNVPPECGECDCHCDSDCKNCEICSASGECVPDPACPDCDGPICPQASGGCCDSGETCYRPAPDQDGQACCESGKKLVDIYINEVRMGPSSVSSFLSIGGPAQMSLVGPCECGATGSDCSGQPVACTDPAARSRLLIANYYGTGDDPCDGGTVRCFPYQDPSCNWNDGPFDPVLLDTTLFETHCC